ncbi:NrfD/PsrC family molybdoenzyme membrane anchor subunit [Chloroflexota bacterium]
MISDARWQNRTDPGGVKTAVKESKLIWGLKVTFYLFLGGVGSGALGLTAFLNLIYKGQYDQVNNVGAWIGLLAVAIGVLLLMADLGVPSRSWRLVFNRDSMISIGSIILSLFLLIAGASVSLSLSFFPWYGDYAVSQTVGILGVILAFATAAYTGLLLGVVKARPFWNTPLLPILWVVSSISAGIASVTLMSTLFAVNLRWDQTVLLGRVEMYLLVAELVMIGLYLLVMHNSAPVAARSVYLLVKGRLSLTFWIGLVVLGLVLPLVIYLGNLGGPIIFIADFMVLIGAFLLRYIFLRSGLRALVPGESIEDSYM